MRQTSTQCKISRTKNLWCGNYPDLEIWYLEGTNKEHNPEWLFCVYGMEQYYRTFYYATDKYEISMELPGLRTWIVFYLLSFVVLLWAAFLSAQGVMLWVSLLLVILIVGVNFATVLNQIKLHASRKEFLRNLTAGFDREIKEEDGPKTQ